MLCWTGGHTARGTLESYVRNEPASLRHPHPRPCREDSGVTQADRLTDVSPGAALSPFRLRFLRWHRPLSWRAPRLAPRPRDCWPGEQVASGSAQQLGGQSWRWGFGNSLLGDSCSLEGLGISGMSPLYLSFPILGS